MKYTVFWDRLHLGRDLTIPFFPLFFLACWLPCFFRFCHLFIHVCHFYSDFSILLSLPVSPLPLLPPHLLIHVFFTPLFFPNSFSFIIYSIVSSSVLRRILISLLIFSPPLPTLLSIFLLFLLLLLLLFLEWRVKVNKKKGKDRMKGKGMGVPIKSLQLSN